MVAAGTRNGRTNLAFVPGSLKHVPARRRLAARSQHGHAAPPSHVARVAAGLARLSTPTNPRTALDILPFLLVADSSSRHPDFRDAPTGAPLVAPCHRPNRLRSIFPLRFMPPKSSPATIHRPSARACRKNSSPASFKVPPAGRIVIAEQFCPQCTSVRLARCPSECANLFHQ